MRFAEPKTNLQKEWPKGEGEQKYTSMSRAHSHDADHGHVPHYISGGKTICRCRLPATKANHLDRFPFIAEWPKMIISKNRNAPELVHIYPSTVILLMLFGVDTRVYYISFYVYVSLSPMGLCSQSNRIRYAHIHADAYPQLTFSLSCAVSRSRSRNGYDGCSARWVAWCSKNIVVQEYNYNFEKYAQRRPEPSHTLSSIIS